MFQTVWLGGKAVLDVREEMQEVSLVLGGEAQQKESWEGGPPTFSFHSCLCLSYDATVRNTCHGGPGAHLDSDICQSLD